MTNQADLPFCTVYGPVDSWRYGRSLGIDPIGAVSTCSFNCVYCQLGDIEHHIAQRQVFVPTAQIQADLQPFAPWEVDIVTLSGSGEPTLALNLGDILQTVKTTTAKPVAVLTNGTLLSDPTVRTDLAIADTIAVKLDAVTAQQWQRINRPVLDLRLTWILTGLKAFRQHYTGNLAIQTMVLAPWSELEQSLYIAEMEDLAPDEIQLNTPTRPKPLSHQLDGRGNHETELRSYPVRYLKPVSIEVLQAFGDRIQSALGIPVRYPPVVTP
ncbi:MAG: radical SAM protein, partial [Thermosynechococcaceae cyanobacterium]